MGLKMTRLRMEDLFEIKSGDYHAIHELDYGNVPLISCGDLNHGYIGCFDIPANKRYSDTITVAYNGQVPLTAKFRPYEFGAKDDVGILVPHTPVGSLSLAYVAAILNSMRWRFSYGRKCFKTKLALMRLNVPVIRENGTVVIDELHIEDLVGDRRLDLRPRPSGERISVPTIRSETKQLCEIFDLRRGDFHSLKGLGRGTCATVSRTENDNGVVGYFEQPDGSIRYPPGVITVSTVSGDAFVQVEDFIATDNVIVCVPLTKMQSTTAYFIAAMINHQKWRYGYGRQCYKEKLSAVAIQLPWRDGHIDEAAIRPIVERQPYWEYVSTQITGQETP